MRKIFIGLFLSFLLLPLTKATFPPEVIQSIVKIRTETGQGSGVIISKDGFLLTNQHVIAGADQVQICFNESFIDPPKCTHTARVIGSDENIDIALLQINRSSNDLNYLKVNTAKTLQLGDRVKAIGFPDMGGETLTLTEGNLSGLESVSKYLKHSAMISSGNSGGALLNENNELAGLNVAVASGNFGQVGLAIPIEIVR